METIINAFKGTPWWVYLVFIYLLRLGIKALKPQTISINKLLILPLIFLAWSIYGLIAKFEGAVDFLAWVISLVVGYVAGYSLFKPWKIRADRKKLLIHLKGSWVVLVLVIAVFVVKYFFGYYYATRETVSPAIHFANLSVTGIITGLFVGRLYIFIKKFSKAKHENLKKGGTPRKKSLL